MAEGGISSIVIERPVRDVFSFMSEPRNWRQFAPEMGEVVMEGPLREGTTFREKRKFLGRPSWADWTVTRFEPGRALAARFRWGPLRGDFAYLFDAAGPGTELTQLTDVRLTGPLAPLSPIVAAETQKAEDAELGRLKAILERR
jgi:hypothetical protein